MSCHLYQPQLKVEAAMSRHISSIAWITVTRCCVNLIFCSFGVYLTNSVVGFNYKQTHLMRMRMQMFKV